MAPNKVCLTFRFCIDIRSLLIHNTALGRTIEAKIEANENRNKVKIPVNLNAARRSYTNLSFKHPMSMISCPVSADNIPKSS